MHQLVSGLVGAVVGLVTAAIVGDGRRWAALDALVGAVGAVPAAWLLTPFSRTGEAFGAVDGAVFVLALWILCRPESR